MAALIKLRRVRNMAMNGNFLWSVIDIYNLYTITQVLVRSKIQQEIFVKHVCPPTQESACNMLTDKVNPCSYAVFTMDELLIGNHSVNKP